MLSIFQLTKNPENIKPSLPETKSSAAFETHIFREYLMM
jgi:hypothetical protein